MEISSKPPMHCGGSDSAAGWDPGHKAIFGTSCGGSLLISSGFPRAWEYGPSRRPRRFHHVTRVGVPRPRATTMASSVRCRYWRRLGKKKGGR
jgi:hypothetical protein